ncbi:MAG: hypothetical protein WAW73_06330 [Rhodoferax sp.]
MFELINDGAKPISSADFESPIEMVATNKAGIVRAIVTETNPPNLAPSVSVEDGRLKLKPMLINPGDSMTMALLTKGEAPSFRPQARIAGVQSVPLVEEVKKSLSVTAMFLFLAAGSLFAIIANMAYSGTPSTEIQLRPRATFLVFIMAAQGAAMCLLVVFQGMGVDGVWPVIVAMIALTAITAPISNWLNRAVPVSTAL